MQKFRNEFLDKLITDSEPYQQAKNLRIFGTRLKRTKLAKILNIHPETIRRYESSWNKAEIPQWYFIVLRFISGDLSFHGNEWTETIIDPIDQKLKSFYAKYQGFKPMDLQINNTIIYKQQQNKLRERNSKISEMEKKIEALEKDNALLSVKNERLKKEFDQKQIVKELIKNKKILKFKR